MSWWGKVVGGALGMAVGGPLGAMLGVAVGHGVDKARGAFSFSTTEQAQTAFFTALFAVLGHLAKADGRVSEKEVAAVEAMMSRMRFGSDQRRAAIALFNQGKAADFDVASVVNQFYEITAGERNLHLVFLEMVIDAALADGDLVQAEIQVLQKIATQLRLTSSQLQLILRMRAGASSFRYQHSSRPRQPRAAVDSTADYATLGLTPDVGDAELKRGYRKLMSRHHPDKLVSQGLPEEMMAQAQQQAAEIQAAYDRIKKSRGLR